MVLSPYIDNRHKYRHSQIDVRLLVFASLADFVFNSTLTHTICLINLFIFFHLSPTQHTYAHTHIHGCTFIYSSGKNKSSPAHSLFILSFHAFVSIFLSVSCFHSSNLFIQQTQITPTQIQSFIVSYLVLWYLLTFFLQFYFVLFGAFFCFL